MPRYVVEVLSRALEQRLNISLGRAKILIVGLTYKKNVPDIRESPSFKLMEILRSRGAKVEYHDPYIATIPLTREYSKFAGLKSVAIIAGELEKVDAVVIATDHDQIDYSVLSKYSKLVVDTRNVMERKGVSAVHVIKA
jgi:UDP-N-acetyl-D-glucosamine dehydrogenase